VDIASRWPGHGTAHIAFSPVSILCGPDSVLLNRWWKVRPRLPASSASEPAAEGLVPRNYLIPMPPLRTVTALYAYEPQNDEELGVSEDETLELFEEDGDWVLCGRVGSPGAGWLPTTWVEQVQFTHGCLEYWGSTDAFCQIQEEEAYQNVVRN
jgi:hypothetical protein